MEDQLTKRIKDFLVGQTTARASYSSGEYAVATATGLVRKQNQDSALIVKARYATKSNRDFDLAVVCDGLGGMRQGAEASALGLSVFVSKVIRSGRAAPDERLLNAMRSANYEIFSVLRGEGGTTMSAVLVTRSEGSILCHAGDSRIYALHETEAFQLTDDDTLQAALKKQKNSLHEGRDTRLLQFVGMGDDLEPHVFWTDHEGAKAYLASSDGAYDIPDSFLKRVISSTNRQSDLPEKLIQLSEMLGGLDNATALVIPTSLETEGVRPSEGLELSLLGVSGRFDIWIPQLVEDRQSADVVSGGYVHAVGRDASGKVVEIHSSPESRKNQNERSSSKTKRARKGSRRKGKAAEVELPLSEPLTIQFPKKSKD